jgi:hypothetical protein
MTIARVADVFHMDPVAVLLGSEAMVHIRVAAMQVVARDEAKKSRDMKK